MGSSYYIFRCHKDEEFKLQEFYENYLKYIQFTIRNSRIDGFLIKKSSSTLSILKEQGIKGLVVTAYSGDPFVMYSKYEKSPTMKVFGTMNSKHYVKRKPKFTRKKRKVEKGKYEESNSVYAEKLKFISSFNFEEKHHITLAKSWERMENEIENDKKRSLDGKVYEVRYNTEFDFRNYQEVFNTYFNKNFSGILDVKEDDTELISLGEYIYADFYQYN